MPLPLLLECKKFEAFRYSGVYFLFGKKNVYVGKAEVRKTGKGIHQRIVEHESDKLKDLWDEVVLFTTKDNSLGLTDISFLENKFYNKANAVGRYKTVNDQEPNSGTVTEEKESELEEYMEWAELILGLLGYNVFNPITDIEKPDQPKKPKPVIKSKVPELPVKTKDTKVGKYVHTAMTNLKQSGYVFSSESIDEMCSEKWSKEHFHIKAFMRRYVEGETNNKDAKGHGRFWAEIFKFGNERVYISKEWKVKLNHFVLFDKWYETL